MPARERAYDRAQLRAAQITRRIGTEIRTARTSLGRSQRDVAAVAHISQTTLSRLERGALPLVDVRLTAVVAAMVGLDLAVNLYPGPHVIRDAASVGLLQRGRELLGPDYGWRYEVQVAPGDQRAWDARIRHKRTGFEAVMEAETRLFDVQSTFRRISLKREASGNPRVIVIVAATRHNRAAVAAARAELLAEFPVTPRRAVTALRAGVDPGGDALIVLGPDTLSRRTTG